MHVRVVLMGDAAQALPSSSGQGVSQALSDALAVALLLKHHLAAAYEEGSKRGHADQAVQAIQAAEKRAMQKAWPQYETVRKANVEKILDDSLKTNDWKRHKGLLETYIMYAFLWVLCRLSGSRLLGGRKEYNVQDEVDRVIREGTIVE